MPYRTPLIDLFLAISDARDWLNQLGKRLFEPCEEHDDPISAAEFVESFRTAAADLIVWLEIKGRSEAAGEVDDAIASMIEVAREYDRRELHAWLPDDEQAGPVEPVDQLIQAMEVASGRLENLEENVPPEVWEGYDDA